MNSINVTGVGRPAKLLKLHRYRNIEGKIHPNFHVLGHVWNVQNCILDLHFYKDAFPTQCPLNLHIKNASEYYNSHVPE